jgi:ribosome-binding factor A
MTESKRQKQVAGVIQKELNEIFLRSGLNVSGGGMVSIASVKITPDLLEARIYISFFQIKEKQVALEKIREKTSDIRRELGKRVRHQLRNIPHLSFFLDDTLDYVFKIEELIDNLKKDKQE